MRILHVIPSLGPVRGGPSFVLRTLARGLADSGVEVHVASTDDNGRDRLAVNCGVPMTDAGVTYWYFPRQTRFYSASLPLNRWLALHVADYDVVHIHALFSFSSTAAAYWARKRQVPYVVRPLGTLNRWGMKNRRRWLKRFSLRFLERRVLEGAAAIHFTSQQERLEAAELGITNHPVVIPNPLDRGDSTEAPVRGLLRSKHSDLANRIWVLFLSRLDRIKGLDLLLPAFAQLRTQHPDVALVLAGDGDPDFVTGLHRQAAALRIERDIIWTGFVTGEQKRAAFVDSDLFVLPSYSENFGVAVLDAMAFGLPVVVSDGVAIHDEISEAKAGLIIPCDETALFQALNSLVEDADLRLSLGRNGRSLSRKFSLENAVTKLLELYAQVGDPRKGTVHRGQTSPTIPVGTAL
jgi:glycosyltransferase involved in cell wall biosynthesis